MPEQENNANKPASYPIKDSSSIPAKWAGEQKNARPGDDMSNQSNGS